MAVAVPTVASWLLRRAGQRAPLEVTLRQSSGRKR